MHHGTKMLLILMAAVCLISGVPGSAQAFSGKLQLPAEGTSQIITLEDGSSLVGRITEIGENEIKFQGDLGEMTIAISKIKEIKEVSGSAVKGGKYWFPNPNRTRLLFGPTGRTLKAGDGYFFDLWIFFPGLAYGITDNFMISGGVSIIPGVNDQMFYITPKFGFAATDKLDLAVSVTAFRLWSETFYIGLGNMTYGTDDKSLTFGLGTAWTNKAMADKPAATLGGEYRLSRRTALVGESWFIPGDNDNGLIALGGLRLLGEKMTIDLGVAYSFEDDQNDSDYPDESEDEGAHWIPYIDFVWSF